MKHLKYVVLTPDQLAAIVKNRLKRIRYRPTLIDGFLAQSGLSLEPNRRKHQTLAFQPLVAATRDRAANRCARGSQHYGCLP